MEKLGIRKLQLRDAALLILRNEGGGGGFGLTARDADRGG